LLSHTKAATSFASACAWSALNEWLAQRKQTRRWRPSLREEARCEGISRDCYNCP
jgi:hypothetical protein